MKKTKKILQQQIVSLQRPVKCPNKVRPVTYPYRTFGPHKALKRRRAMGMALNSFF